MINGQLKGKLPVGTYILYKFINRDKNNYIYTQSIYIYPEINIFQPSNKQIYLHLFSLKQDYFLFFPPFYHYQN